MLRSKRGLWEEWGEANWHFPFQAILVSLAALRIGFAWISYAWILWRPSGVEPVLQLHVSATQTLIFGLSGIFLYRRGAEDSRARILGITFLLIANAHVALPIQYLRLALMPRFEGLMALALGLEPNTFLPFFFWNFVALFPSASHSLSLQRIIVLGRRLSLLVGSWFFLLGSFRACRRIAGWVVNEYVEAVTLTFFRMWYVLIPLLGIAMPVVLLKFRQLKALEKRRAGLFFQACVLFLCLPFGLLFLDDVLPGIFQHGMFIGHGRIYFTNFLLMMFPLATTYTVLAHRVLDVQNIARSAVRHMLARYSVVLLGLVPFGFLAYFGWANRHSTLVELFSGSAAMVLLAASALGLVAIFYRQPLLEAIDRRFFRERYNARRVLTELTEQLRGTRNLVELAKLVERGVDLALHLERVSLLVENPGVGRFVDPQAQLRPLDPGAQLITLVAGSREPLAVDLAAPSSPFLALPEEEKLWLLDSRIEMIAPAHSLDGALIGLLAFGPKRSELPFLREDRELLASVASSAGLVIELLRLKETVAPAAAASLALADPAAAAALPAGASGADEEAACECIACDRVFPPGTSECPHCHVDLEKTNAPYILRDLYRLDQRLGAGGMAVVYRAKDLKLGRSVAVKTLPRVNAEAAMRLRREARTAASVSHPGLAAIYGLETWRGVPLIITELLPGGTLADQLGRDPLAPLDALDMARTIALALAKIHAVGILHRDVKPSNIGYTEDGAVKLLDFGIARIQHDFRQEKGDADTVLGPDGRSRIVNTASVMLPRTRTGQLVGTVTYLSPEAARGEKPDPSVDLWALAVCLYEALTAENLFYGRTFQDVLAQIRDLKIPDVRKKAPSCPEPLALFLAQELSLDRSRRAEDGLEMATRLDQTRAKMLT